jgi:hypothetical protein
MEKINIENLAKEASKLEKINAQIENLDDQNERERLLEEASALENKLDLLEEELGLDGAKLLKVYEQLTPLEAYTELQEIDSDQEDIGRDITGGNFHKIIERLRQAKLSSAKLLRLAACALSLFVAVGAASPELSAAKEPEKITSTAESKDKEQKAYQDLKEWRAQWKAEDIISDSELRSFIGLYEVRADKAIEVLEEKVKLRKLHRAARTRAKREDTYKTYIDQEGKRIEEYSLSGFRWDYRKKDWVEDKINVVQEKEGAGGGEEKISEKQGISREQVDIEDCFAPGGQEEFLRVLKEKFGPNGEKAFKYNISLLKEEFNKYYLGELSKDQIIKDLKQSNQNIRNLGGRFDVFDIDKLIKILSRPSHIINSDAADPDAW